MKPNLIFAVMPYICFAAHHICISDGNLFQKNSVSMHFLFQLFLSFFFEKERKIVSFLFYLGWNKVSSENYQRFCA